MSAETATHVEIGMYAEKRRRYVSLRVSDENDGGVCVIIPAAAARAYAAMLIAAADLAEAEKAMQS